MCVLAQALSADGRCKTFDAGADGYGRGEGFAVAYLNPSASSSHALAFLQVLLYAMTLSPLHHIRISQQQLQGFSLVGRCQRQSQSQICIA